MIEIRYVLQIEDFMDAIRASYASDKRGKRVRIAMIAIGIAIVPLVFYEFPTARTEMKWMGFAYALETPNTFSLFTIANLLYVFPNRAFSEQPCAEFPKMIVQNGIPTKPR